MTHRVTTQESWVVLTVEEKPKNFLLDSGQQLLSVLYTGIGFPFLLGYNYFNSVS